MEYYKKSVCMYRNANKWISYQMMIAMKVTIMLIVAFATSYSAIAAPINATNDSICYCLAEGSDSSSDIQDTAYARLNDAMEILHTFCDLSSLVSL